ncbi:hypothetical protein F0562_014898 [Nyssa sinensis]|uniref:Uncharacterized protein n=1 Tax=Nyssa sinensis TaxID=561372 RepID=A0A5J4ZTC3_9ASTE|nr:hypothetical protein F0562_014898 [Nyssa sinensis]
MGSLAHSWFAENRQSSEIQSALRYIFFSHLSIFIYLYRVIFEKSFVYLLQLYYFFQCQKLTGKLSNPR